MIQSANPSALYVTKRPGKLADGTVCHHAYLRYDLWDEKQGRRQPKSLASLGRVENLDEDWVESLTGFLRQWLRKDSKLPFEALQQRFREQERTFQMCPTTVNEGPVTTLSEGPR